MEKDEEKLMNRKRLEKWIKIFLLFLAFVWLCTIISKSIYVSGLPIVKTETPSKKYVEHIVETDGIVTTGGEIAVNTQSGLRVDRLYVMQGDEVKAGDVLFTIDTEDIADIISEKETELSKMQYHLSDIQTNAAIDAQKKEAAVLWAQEDYETADYETLIAIERAQQALDKAQAQLGEHLANTVPHTSDSARQAAWDAYRGWVNSGYNISDKITEKEREIQDLQEQLAQLGQNDSSSGKGKTLSGAAGSQEASENADENESTKSSEHNTDEVGESQDRSEMDSAVDTSGSEVDNDVSNDSIEVDVNAKEENNTSADTNDNTESDITGEDHKESTDNKSDVENNTEKDSNVDDNADINHKDNENADPDTDDNHNTETSPEDGSENNNSENENSAERTNLYNKIRKANEELLALQDELTKHDRNAVKQPDYSEEELKYDEWQKTRLTLEENVQKANENYMDMIYNREVALRQKLRDLVSAQAAATADSTAAIYELDMKQIQTQLTNLYTLQKQNGEIKAASDGIISKIQVEVGSRTSDTAAILITDTQRPCQFKFSITKEQGKYVHLNDTVSLKLNGQSEIEVTVDYFTENAQGGYDLICMLPQGAGKPGLSGSVKKSVQGEYQDLTLPIDAVFEESNGSYLYILNEKEGILGSEYYAEKIKVQIKDKNDRFAALESGTVDADTKVITQTTKELKQGESVRPQDK